MSRLLLNLLFACCLLLGSGFCRADEALNALADKCANAGGSAPSAAAPAPSAPTERVPVPVVVDTTVEDIIAEVEGTPSKSSSRAITIRT